LLAELHAHTTWSDGALALPALVDLYGSHGFDVLCVTDHVLPGDRGIRCCVGVHNWRAYLDHVESEAARALSEYRMILVPGVEFTDDHTDATRSAHALAIGLRTFVSVDLGIRTAVAEARRAGAAIVAAIRTRRARTDAARAAGGTSEIRRSSCPTATSSSTDRTCSAGWPSAACRRSRPAISTVSNT
jgi:hypothetical protein